MTDTIQLPVADWAPLPIHVRSSSDGRRLAVAGQTGVVSIVDLRPAGPFLRSFLEEEGEVETRAGVEVDSRARYDLALTPDGRFVAWQSRRLGSHR